MIPFILLIISIWQLITSYHWGWVVLLIISIVWLIAKLGANDMAGKAGDIFDVFGD